MHEHVKNSLKVDDKDVNLPWIICEVSMHVATILLCHELVISAS